MMLSYQTGPGGAVQALINMQTCWQVLFDAIFLGQAISMQQWIGMAFGLTSSLFISIGDNCVECCMPKDEDKEKKRAEGLEPLINAESAPDKSQ